jgi:hypothetical protein
VALSSLKRFKVTVPKLLEASSSSRVRQKGRYLGELISDELTHYAIRKVRLMGFLGELIRP